MAATSVPRPQVPPLNLNGLSNGVAKAPSKPLLSSASSASSAFHASAAAMVHPQPPTVSFAQILHSKYVAHTNGSSSQMHFRAQAAAAAPQNYQTQMAVRAQPATAAGGPMSPNVVRTSDFGSGGSPSRKGQKVDDSPIAVARELGILKEESVRVVVAPPAIQPAFQQLPPTFCYRTNATVKQVCFYFLKNNCHWGAGCKYLHPHFDPERVVFIRPQNLTLT